MITAECDICKDRAFYSVMIVTWSPGEIPRPDGERQDLCGNCYANFQKMLREALNKERINEL